jgi:hypothetical protein
MMHSELLVLDLSLIKAYNNYEASRCFELEIQKTPICYELVAAITNTGDHFVPLVYDDVTNKFYIIDDTK